MTRHTSSILFVCLLLILSCTSEPDYVRDYPQLLSSGITSISPAGVKVTGTISEDMMSKVTDHGVIWAGSNVNLTITSGFKKSLGVPTSGNFTIDVNAQLLPGKDYVLKVYLKTDKHLVYGLPLSFKSQGSQGPVVESISPTVVAPKDIITIKGQAFGKSVTTTKVDFVGAEYSYPAVIKTLSETEMTVEVPVIYEQSFKVKITVPENSPSTSTMSLSRKLPKINSMTTTDICSPITFKGEDLLTFGGISEIKINNVNVLPVPDVNDISFAVPARFHAPALNVKVTFLGGYSITTTHTDPVKRPVVTGTAPATIAAFESFVITGTDFPTQCGSFTLSSQNTMTITSITSTEITVKAGQVGCDPVKVTLSYDGMPLFVSDPIALRDFSVTSISPNQGKIGDNFTVYGAELTGVQATMGTYPGNFTLPGESVRLSTLAGTGEPSTQTFYISAPDVIDNLPRTADGITTITIHRCSHSEAFTYKLEVPVFTFTDFTPKTNAGSPPVLTITGTGFVQGMDVYLTNPATGAYVDALPIKQTTNTEIVTFVPPMGFIPPGNYKLVVSWLGRKFVFPGTIEILFN